jgi:hypothetical protein
MTYVFDVDGTVCSTVNDGDYSQAKPYKHRIDVINDLYEQGNKIIFHTARGMGRHNNNANLANASFYKFTYKQLVDWGVKFNKLYLGKPSGDIYIDDKGVKDEDFFNT